MRWHLVNSDTLEDSESGYQIHLISGTWFHPGRLKPQAPSSMDFPEQIKCLRSGLQHIRHIGENSAQKNKRHNDTDPLFKSA